jgi:glutaryl-CoA dehydrogenase
LTPISSDFYTITDLLEEDERVLLGQVRHFLEAEVAPIINHYWSREEFPHNLLPQIAGLNIAGTPYEGYSCQGKGSLLDGFLMMELARVDCSIATFYAVHSGLAMGSIYHCGSEAQKERWLPVMARLERIGAFGLTEPASGSDAARGLQTTARRDGDTWVLNGQKKWIGNATFADVVVIWARDEADRQVKGFLVEKGTPGFSPVKMKDKMALRVVQNAEISLKDCRVPETHRLQNAHSFKDVAAILRSTRAGVAWIATGCMRSNIRGNGSSLAGQSAASKWFKTGWPRCWPTSWSMPIVFTGTRALRPNSPMAACIATPMLISTNG